MIVERNEFRLKFGKAKDAIGIWKEILSIYKGSKDAPQIRLMSDMTGPAYTIVLELQIKSLIDFGLKNYQWMTNEKVAALYQQFIPLCESSHRTLYNIEDEI